MTLRVDATRLALSDENGDATGIQVTARFGDMLMEVDVGVLDRESVIELVREKARTDPAFLVRVALTLLGHDPRKPEAPPRPFAGGW